MAETIKGISVVISGETTGLQKALGDVNKKSRDLNSELRQVERLLKMDPGNTEMIAQQQQLLAEAVDNSREKLDSLRAAEQQVRDQFARGEISQGQMRAFEREVAAAEQQLQRFEERMQQTQQSSRNLGVTLGDVGGKLKSIGQTMTLGVTTPIVGGFMAITQGTKELRTELAYLETNANAAGVGMEATNEALRTLNGLRDDTVANAEAVNELLASGFDNNNLQAALEGVAGAAIKFKDTLNFEGIADGLQETLATGESAGSFLEVLDRMGVKTDEWNAGLQEAIANGTQEQYVLDTLANLGMNDLYNSFVKTNPELVKANQAQHDFQMAMAGLGTAIQPILTSITEKIAELVNEFNEMSPTGQKVVLAIAGIAAVIGPLLVIIGALITSVTSIAGLFGAGGALATAFVFITGPIGITIAAIAGLIAIGVAVYKNWDEIKAKAIEIWNSITSSVSRAAGDVTTAVETSLENTCNYIRAIPAKALQWGKDIINGLIKGIKSLKIPMPHFDFSVAYRSIAGVRFPVPDVDVNWYDKGGIFANPAIIGVGEKRPEVVAPLEELRNMVAIDYNRLAMSIVNAMRGAQFQVAGGGNITALVLDNQDLMKLERKLQPIRQLEKARRGE